MPSYTEENLLMMLKGWAWTSNGDGGITTEVPKAKWEALNPEVFPGALAEHVAEPTKVGFSATGLAPRGGPADYTIELEFDKKTLAALEEKNLRFWSDEALVTPSARMQKMLQNRLPGTNGRSGSR